MFDQTIFVYKLIDFNYYEAIFIMTLLHNFKTQLSKRGSYVLSSQQQGWIPQEERGRESVDLMWRDSSPGAFTWECGSGFTVITHRELSNA